MTIYYTPTCALCGTSLVPGVTGRQVCPACNPAQVLVGRNLPQRSPKERNAPCGCGSGRKWKWCCAIRQADER